MLLRKFDYDTAGLPAVVNDQSLDLLKRSFFEGKTGAKFKKHPGIKTTDDLHYMEQELHYQADTGCAFNASGDTTFSKRTIAVGKIKVQNEWCVKTLEGFWTERALAAGSNYDSLAFETDIMTYMKDKLVELKEVALWQSAIGGGAGLNLIQYDGFIDIIETAATYINGNPTGITTVTGITSGNVIGIFDGMWSVLPARLINKPDIEFMCGWDTFNLLILALKNANMFHYDGVNASPYQNGTIILPGTGIKVEAYHGLTDTDKILLARTDNFVIGCDLESDEDYFDVRENPITKTLMMDIHFKEGTQVKFPNEIVYFKLV